MNKSFFKFWVLSTLLSKGISTIKRQGQPRVTVMLSGTGGTGASIKDLHTRTQESCTSVVEPQLRAGPQQLVHVSKSCFPGAGEMAQWTKYSPC